MKKRTTLIGLVALFLLAYGVFLALSSREHSEAAAPPSLEPRQPAIERAPPLDHSQPQLAQAAPPAAVEQAAPDERPASVRAVFAQDAAVRAAAIIELGAIASSESIDALARAARSDAAPDNRVQAIEALQMIGMNQDAHGEIETVLMQLSADADPRIASRAQSALEQLATVE